LLELSTEGLGGIGGELKLDGAGRWIGRRLETGEDVAVEDGEGGEVGGGIKAGMMSVGRGKNRIMPSGNCETVIDFPYAFGVMM